jgi:hypothetical protein
MIDRMAAGVFWLIEFTALIVVACVCCVILVTVTLLVWHALAELRTANAGPTEAGTHAGGNKKAID